MQQWMYLHVETAFDFLEDVFEADRSESMEIPRGMVEKIRKFHPEQLGKVTFKPEDNQESVNY